MYGTGFVPGDSGSPLGNPSIGAGAAPEPREARARIVRGGWLIDAPSFEGMTEKKTDKRDSPISYRPPADLADEFRRRVEQSGLSVNAYINRAVFNAPIPRGARTPPAEKQMLALIVSRSGAIRDALEAAVRKSGGDARTADAAEAAVRELEIITAGVLKMLERGP